MGRHSVPPRPTKLSIKRWSSATLHFVSCFFGGLFSQKKRDEEIFLWEDRCIGASLRSAPAYKTIHKKMVIGDFVFCFLFFWRFVFTKKER